MIITVYPTKASALNVKHPHGPQMAVGGVKWPRDSFTGRMLSDRIATEDESKAFRPPAPAADPASTQKPATPAVAETVAPAAPADPG